MKKILLIMNNITTGNMQGYFGELGFTAEKWMSPDENMEKAAESLAQVLDKSFYGVFTYDFYPEFAQVCKAKGVLYLSWIVDNPHFSLWSEEARYDTNRIFVFDRCQQAKLAGLGLKNTFYLPLGADVEYFDNLSGQDDDLGAEVAFVGSLYNDPAKNLFGQIEGWPGYIEGYLNGLLQCQQRLSENILTKDMLPLEVWEGIKQKVKLSQKNAYSFSYEECFLNILQKEATKRERCLAVTYLNEFFDFKLYTGSSVDFSPELKKEGYIDYETKMPLVFRQSRINVNITLRSITSGIPLRALDVMACGGFLLSNCQPELQEYFEEDKECVFFYDLEDMVWKADYYLKHEEERRQIAEAGYRKVKEKFSLKGQMKKMLEML